MVCFVSVECRARKPKASRVFAFHINGFRPISNARHHSLRANRADRLNAAGIFLSSQRNRTMSDEKKGSDTTEGKLSGLIPFKSGPEWTGNRLGRPKGSRNKLSEAFLSAMCNDFEVHGQTVIDTVRADKPADYLKIIAAIVPKEFNITTTPLEDMSDEDLLDNLDRVRALTAAILGAAPKEGTRQTRRDKAARGKPN